MATVVAALFVAAVLVAAPLPAAAASRVQQGSPIAGDGGTGGIQESRGFFYDKLWPMGSKGHKTTKGPTGIPCLKGQKIGVCVSAALSKEEAWSECYDYCNGLVALGAKETEVMSDLFQSGSGGENNGGEHNSLAANMMDGMEDPMGQCGDTEDDPRCCQCKVAPHM
uniref:Uncharacterized protein n=1 Tax=Tetraselmis sp. GSL018 TaxID=582737 RepID=A0A061RY98_9CHLO|mmetsp:Transcript_2816/g.6559  ORF Transcript_2816/g.6559 Transcript_2816/m.6559 type:complete len:167 (+) Transcript_2816:274-774(+)|eukprot:CAMPEP_0177613794 /NCGR_PEP_ID=MMETSP0419_2-20121207/22231_1 /TAXON_ID=582737 /ORGANISM="Tetraselmis sp., Strain GSL018" /LENGTH=166 /DNA_ID=CAMNT_0019110647 /DNA_START=239 /DNA_END=739 /DNA_ORIENTATION=-